MSTAQMISELPKKGSRSLAADSSTPKLVVPLTKTRSSNRERLAFNRLSSGAGTSLCFVPIRFYWSATSSPIAAGSNSGSPPIHRGLLAHRGSLYLL